MRIAVFSSQILWTPQWATDLELIQRHLDEGHTVTHLYCQKDLPACDTNPYLNYEACQRCVRKRDHGYELIHGNFRTMNFMNLTAEDKQFIANLPTRFETLDDLQSLKIDNFDLGYAVASSVISAFRDPKPNLDHEMVYGFLIGTAGVYLSLINYLKQNPTDRVYVFNGRFTHLRAILRACQQMGVECYTHERGNSINHFVTFKNSILHMADFLQDAMDEQWDEAEPQEREEVSEKFYLNRRTGNTGGLHAYTGKQEAILPDNWDPEKVNIGVFNSSEDEFASLGKEWKNHIYVSQFEALKQLKADVKDWKDYHFYLRIHPNLNHVKNEQTIGLPDLDGGNFTIIPADSPVSTYEILFAADKVLTYGSSVGIEAVYWEKPSILAGKSLFRGMGGTYEPDSHEQVLEMLQTNLEPLPKEAAKKYGYYFRSFGQPYKFYKGESSSHGTFKDSVLEEHLSLDEKLINWLVTRKLPFSVMEHYHSWRRSRRIEKFKH